VSHHNFSYFFLVVLFFTVFLELLLFLALARLFEVELAIV